MKPKTHTVLHETADTGKSMLIEYNEVNANTLNMYEHVMRDMLKDKKRKDVFLTPKNNVYGVGFEDSTDNHTEMFTAHIYHTDYSFPLLRVDVYPPSESQRDGRSVSSLIGIRQLKQAHNGVMTQEIRDMLALIGDSARVLAWAWLVHRGFIDTLR